MFARHPLSELTLQAMVSVANGIALGIERKRAEDEIHRLNEHLECRLRQTRALRQIDAAITTGSDLGQTLALVVEQAVDQLGVDAADILLCDRGATGS